jgi:hypothetical protein
LIKGAISFALGCLLSNPGYCGTLEEDFGLTPFSSKPASNTQQFSYLNVDPGPSSSSTSSTLNGGQAAELPGSISMASFHESYGASCEGDYGPSCDGGYGSGGGCGCSGNGGSCGCDSGGGCCSCCGPVAMIEATFLFPTLHRDPVSTTIQTPLTRGPVTNQEPGTGTTNSNLFLGPRITLGYQCECWGILFRYWNAQSWSNGLVGSPHIDPTVGYVAYDTLRAYTTDIELNRRFCYGCWDLNGFGGVRYASLYNSQYVYSANDAFPDFASASAVSGSRFNGTGFTYGWSGNRPLGDCCSPFSLYFVNRYSNIFGPNRVFAQTTANAFTTGQAFNALNGAQASNTGDLFIAELQVGLQWEACLKCVPARAFLRTGFEYQYWQVKSNSFARANSFAATAGNTSSAISSAVARDLSLSLVGFTIGTGFMY